MREGYAQLDEAAVTAGTDLLVAEDARVFDGLVCLDSWTFWVVIDDLFRGSEWHCTFAILLIYAGLSRCKDCPSLSIVTTLVDTKTSSTRSSSTPRQLQRRQDHNISPGLHIAQQSTAHSSCVAKNNQFGGTAPSNILATYPYHKTSSLGAMCLFRWTEFSCGHESPRETIQRCRYMKLCPGVREEILRPDQVCEPCGNEAQQEVRRKAAERKDDRPSAPTPGHAMREPRT